jgi:hypothetical protein
MVLSAAGLPVEGTLINGEFDKAWKEVAVAR